MVGKPNFPPDVDERTDRHGFARPTPGLNTLDEEREASMADEGGMSGAVMEAEGLLLEDEYLEPVEERPIPLVHRVERVAAVATWRGIGLLVACGAAALLVGAVLRRY